MAEVVDFYSMVSASANFTFLPAAPSSQLRHERRLEDALELVLVEAKSR